MPPSLSNLNPASGSSGNLATTNAYLEIVDAVNGIDHSSVVLKVNSVTCWSGDAQQGLFSVTKATVADGYSYDINPDAKFDIGSTVTIGVYAEDLSLVPNILDTSYTFDIVGASSVTYSFDVILDVSGPTITNKDPSPSATGVALDKVVSFHMEDTIGVDLSNTTIYVGGIVAYNGSTDIWHADFDLGSSIAGAATDYTVQIAKDTDWDPYDIVTIRVVTQDIIAQGTDESWNFRTEDSGLPVIVSNSPTGTADKSTDISFSVRHTGFSKIDRTAIQCTVEGSDAIINGVIQPGWDGPNSAVVYNSYDGYDVVLDKTTDLPAGTAIDVSVDAGDHDGGYANLAWTFTIFSFIDSIVTGPFEITLTITFSEEMGPEISLENPTNYQFGGTMYARLVDIVSSRRVRLWVEKYEGSYPFTLNVSSDIVNSQGAPVSPAVVPAPFQSSANISSTNGQIRTWHDSQFIALDEKRVYVAGTRGIDVLDREASQTSPVRWAQIMDSYGISAMFLADIGGAYEFSDSSPPQLENQLPAPGGTVPVSGPIRFSIVDSDTSVEIQASAVYVNGALIFSGASGGFRNGFSGKIVTGHRRLDFTASPETPFSPGSNVTVRVIASDLYGNEMDSSYVLIAQT